MKIEVQDATGPVLDWLVAKCEGVTGADIYVSPGYRGKVLFRRNRNEDGDLTGTYRTGPDLLFTQKWESGGPIIDRERITLRVCVQRGRPWVAFLDHGGSSFHSAKARMTGPTSLIAAMRCYVVSKLGNEVEVPDELL